MLPHPAHADMQLSNAPTRQDVCDTPHVCPADRGTARQSRNTHICAAAVLIQLNSDAWAQVLLPKLVQQGSAAAVALNAASCKTCASAAGRASRSTYQDWSWLHTTASWSHGCRACSSTSPTAQQCHCSSAMTNASTPCHTYCQPLQGRLSDSSLVPHHVLVRLCMTRTLMGSNYIRLGSALLTKTSGALKAMKSLHTPQPCHQCHPGCAKWNLVGRAQQCSSRVVTPACHRQCAWASERTSAVRRSKLRPCLATVCLQAAAVGRAVCYPVR